MASTASAAAPETAAGQVLFSFCVVADPHCAEEPKDGIRQYGGGLEKFLRCIDAMDEMTGVDRTDFVILAGDIHPWAIDGELDRVVWLVEGDP